MKYEWIHKIGQFRQVVVKFFTALHMRNKPSDVVAFQPNFFTYLALQWHFLKSNILQVYHGRTILQLETRKFKLYIYIRLNNTQ